MFRMFKKVSKAKTDLAQGTGADHGPPTDEAGLAYERPILRPQEALDNTLAVGKDTYRICNFKNDPHGR